MSRNAISRLTQTRFNDCIASKSTYFPPEQLRMSSKNPIAQSKNPRLLMMGFALIAALGGCHTNEAHKTDHQHQHAQGQAEAAPISEEPRSQNQDQKTTDATTTSDDRYKATITIGPATTDVEKTRTEARMPAGSELTINLPFQAGTGYSWALSSISSDLKMMSQTVRSLSEDGRAGGPMLAVYVLECLSADSVQTARFELSRPWETDSPPVREIILLVNGAGADTGK